MDAPVEEPLALSAPLARELAPRLCRTDPASGESCAWYHGFWQVLRLLGMGTSVGGHAAFYAEAFGRLPPGPARVLIAGAADYSMLAHAAAACRAAGVQASFTMVDQCETPLALSRWYAERASLPLQTVRRDLLDLELRAGFDAVCTHALLGYFRPEERLRLLAALRRVLRPGGRLMLANRLRPSATEARIAFSAAQVEDFATAVSRNASTLFPGVDLADAARAYAARQAQWPVRSSAEIQALLETAGFRIEHLSCGPMASGPKTRLDVPTIAGEAEYARVVALS